jgi:hypothetical protein
VFDKLLSLTNTLKSLVPTYSFAFVHSDSPTWTSSYKRQAEEKKIIAIEIIQNRNDSDTSPRIRGLCIRGPNAEEKWKLSEQISAFLLETDQLHGLNS